MTGFLLDTNVPSELTRPQSNLHVERWLDEADDEQLFSASCRSERSLRDLRFFPMASVADGLLQWVEATLRPWFEGRILPVTERIAERWGILAGEFQMEGRGLSAADGLIAATALEHDLTVIRAALLAL